jgi:hypothetical protein
VKLAILVDHQNIARDLADWSAVTSRADITVFNDHLADSNALVARLLPFDLICVMRERTAVSPDASNADRENAGSHGQGRRG